MRITGHVQGIWVPMITPFRNGEPDLDALARLTVEFAAAGVHGLVVCGTTGEAATLREEEQMEVLCTVLDAAGPLPVMMGLAGADTEAVSRRAAHLGDQPLAGLLVSAPYYVRPSQQGILQHYRSIAAATDHSIVLYNVPARTGVNIEPATAMRLAQDSRFVAIKEAGGILQQVQELLAHTALDVLAGDDSLLLPTLCAGGHGAISAAAHIRPDLFVRLYRLVQSGHLPEAQQLFRQLLPVIRLLFTEPNPAPLKAAMAMLGKAGNELRLPMTAMSAAGQSNLSRALEAVMALPCAEQLEAA